jgi:molybdopterin molybdotransferase
VADLFHLRDDTVTLLTKLKEMLPLFDVLILSGGVSKGKADFIPEVLQELGVERVFHEVAQRPGKPLWFGKHPQGPVIFALPGNPVSTFVCYYKYVRPWLQANSGASQSWPLKAVLQTEVAFKPNLTYFLLVKLLVNNNGMWTAQPVNIGGSGDFAALLDADGFLELPPQPTVFRPGEIFPFIGFRR